MLRSKLLFKICLGLLAITAAIVPFFIGEYYIDIITTFLINLIIVVSLRLIYTTGLFNLAHIPIMGLGAFASAIMAKVLGLSFWLVLPLAGLASALVGLIFSYPLVRTKGFAFFIASFVISLKLTLNIVLPVFSKTLARCHAIASPSLSGSDAIRILDI